MKWEYKKVLIYYKDASKQLNELGQNRWELCCLLEKGVPNDAIACDGLFKRSIPKRLVHTGPK